MKLKKRNRISQSGRDLERVALGIRPGVMSKFYLLRNWSSFSQKLRSDMKEF